MNYTLVQTKSNYVMVMDENGRPGTTRHVGGKITSISGGGTFATVVVEKAGGHHYAQNYKLPECSLVSNIHID